jgi:hypothetical protein
MKSLQATNSWFLLTKKNVQKKDDFSRFQNKSQKGVYCNPSK